MLKNIKNKQLGSLTYQIHNAGQFDGDGLTGRREAKNRHLPLHCHPASLLGRSLCMHTTFTRRLADGRCVVNGVASDSATVHSQYMKVLHGLVKRGCVYDKRRQHREILGQVFNLASVCKTHQIWRVWFQRQLQDVQHLGLVVRVPRQSKSSTAMTSLTSYQIKTWFYFFRSYTVVYSILLCIVNDWLHAIPLCHLTASFCFLTCFLMFLCTNILSVRSM